MRHFTTKIVNISFQMTQFVDSFNWDLLCEYTVHQLVGAASLVFL